MYLLTPVSETLTIKVAISLLRFFIKGMDRLPQIQVFDTEDIITCQNKTILIVFKFNDTLPSIQINKAKDGRIVAGGNYIPILGLLSLQV